MYRITIHEKSFFTDTEERSHHHFDSAESALRFMAALEIPHKIFVSEVYGHYWSKVGENWQCAECQQSERFSYDIANNHTQCPGNPQVEIDEAYKQLAEDMEFESWREENRYGNNK